MDRFLSDGVGIAYSLEGQGPPVVLAHAFAINSEVNWRGSGWIDWLIRANRSVVTFDLRGHGQSDRPHEPSAYTCGVYEDVIRLLDHLGIERVDFIGYSVGAWVGLSLLAAYPDRLNSSVLMACGRQGLDREHNLFLADVLDGVPCQDPSLKHEAQAMLRIADAVGNDRRALKALLRSNWFPSIRLERVLHNQQPVLLVSGGNDHLVPDPDGMRKRIGNSRMIVVPNANHVTILGDPAVRKDVLAFLDEHGLRQ